MRPCGHWDSLKLSFRCPYKTITAVAKNTNIKRYFAQSIQKLLLNKAKQNKHEFSSIISFGCFPSLANMQKHVWHDFLVLPINAEPRAFQCSEGERSSWGLWKEHFASFGQETVFTRVFMMGHKTLLTTMYLFLKTEKQSPCRGEKLKAIPGQSSRLLPINTSGSSVCSGWSCKHSCFGDSREAHSIP